MFLSIQSVIILICLGILSVHIANARTGTPRKKKKIYSSNFRGSKGHKGTKMHALHYVTR